MQPERLADSKGSISKTEFRDFTKRMSALVDGLPSNFAFMQSQFQGGEDTAQQTKVEVESYISNVATQTGLDALRNNGVVSLAQSNKNERAR